MQLPLDADPSRFDTIREEQLAALRAVDDLVRDLQRAVRREYRDTVFVVTSDNGFCWYEHRVRRDEDEATAHEILTTFKNVPYDESHRVPLVLVYPQKLGRLARIEDGLVTLQDLSATLAEWGGAEPPGQDGISFAETLPAGLPPTRTVVPIEGWRLDGSPLYSGTIGHMRKVFTWWTGEVEEYDRLLDPYELNNLRAVVTPP